MKIYILRHEDRLDDCSLFTPLTKMGLINSNNLKNILNNLKINIIFSSPFIRTLQTIYPYSKYYSYKINLEYGLAEIYHQDLIPIKSCNTELPEYIAESFNYNSEYTSIIKISDIKYPEKYNQVQKRVKQIIYNIICKYWNCDVNIILVTHQSVCRAILELINDNLNNEIYNSYLENYPIGKISLIFDNFEWIFKNIN